MPYSLQTSIPLAIFKAARRHHEKH